MEAGVGSHFLGRALSEQGHEVRLIPAQFVRPFVEANKNDYRDAEAIAEAVERENMRFVPIKTEDQLEMRICLIITSAINGCRTLKPGSATSCFPTPYGTKADSGGT